MLQIKGQYCSVQAKHVNMVELTCPAEEKFEQVHHRKFARYAELEDLIAQGGRISELSTTEVAVRGIVAHSVRKVLLALGLSNKQMARKVGQARSLVVVWCSYDQHFAIWLKHESIIWDFSLEHSDLMKIQI